MKHNIISEKDRAKEEERRDKIKVINMRYSLKHDDAPGYTCDVINAHIIELRRAIVAKDTHKDIPNKLDQCLKFIQHKRPGIRMMGFEMYNAIRKELGEKCPWHSFRMDGIDYGDIKQYQEI